MTPALLLAPIPIVLAAAALLKLSPKQDTPFWRLYQGLVTAGYVGLWAWWVWG